MYQALYRKYRPSNFDEVVGQKVIVKTLKNAIKYDRLSHAYLFCGPRGTGKTSIAKILAKTINCTNLQDYLPCNECENCLQYNNKQSVDIIEIDAASNNGVDEIRELRDKVGLVPSFGKYKIYIIDEVHMLTTSAFNALLKTLEEPPKHVIFILATTEPFKIPITILSRCQRFDFKKISVDDIVSRLRAIADAENIKIKDEILKEIAILSDGGMRDSINLLDQVNAYVGGEKEVTYEDVHDVNGTLKPEELYDFISKIKNNDLKDALLLSDSYNDIGKNMTKVLEELISFFRNILIAKVVPDYLNDNIYFDFYKKIASSYTVEQINDIMKLMNNSLYDMRISNNPKVLFDLLVLNIAEISKEKTVPIEKEKVEQKINYNNENVEQKINYNYNKEENAKENSISNVQNRAQKKIVVKIDDENTKKWEEKKNIRIGNTLACYNRLLLTEVREKLPEVRNYILDINYNFVASLVVDGTLKAAGGDYLVFVYNNVHDANLFNDNIDKIELLFEILYNKKYKVIATSIDEWEKIRDDFNHKRKVFTFTPEKEENTNLETNNLTNQIEEDFGSLITVE
ncbi:dNA polymerase III gamma and tau subunits [Firmicutes bacterium CAG:884]|mgnify:CR=1 FL=1|nr:dNA polymerase III gamma and tau subunits [Firmicutes bacterium CAG:884]